MSSHQFIYWRPDLSSEDGETPANVHVLVGYTQESIADFQCLAAKIREICPTATDEQIHGGKIQSSNRYKGFTIVWTLAYLPQGEYPGWTQIDGSKAGAMPYGW